MRATISAEPPGANGTMIVIWRAGKSCATDVAGMPAMNAASISSDMRFMASSPVPTLTGSCFLFLHRHLYALCLRRPHHAPAHDSGTLERAEHQPLEHEADRTDHGECGEHHVGVEKFLGVEDHPAQAPIGGREHLGAHDRDPRPQKSLPQP